jgi:DNA polymerase delta subunit 2
MLQIAGEHARQVDRVLDVRQGELCWIVGTVYMELPLKPNILEDITKEVCYGISSLSFDLQDQLS